MVESESISGKNNTIEELPEVDEGVFYNQKSRALGKGKLKLNLKKKFGGPAATQEIQGKPIEEEKKGQVVSAKTTINISNLSMSAPQSNMMVQSMRLAMKKKVKKMFMCMGITIEDLAAGKF